MILSIDLCQFFFPSSAKMSYKLLYIKLAFINVLNIYLSRFCNGLPKGYSLKEAQQLHLTSLKSYKITEYCIQNSHTILKWIMLSTTSVGLEYGRVKVVVCGYLWLFVAVFGTVSVAVDSTYFFFS